MKKVLNDCAFIVLLVGIFLVTNGFIQQDCSRLNETRRGRACIYDETQLTAGTLLILIGVAPLVYRRYRKED